MLPEQVRPRAHRAVGRDFVMLDFLCGRDHQRVTCRIVFGVADHLFALGDQMLHALAFLAARRHAELIEHLLETVDVLFGLPQVLVERILQLSG